MAIETGSRQNGHGAGSAHGSSARGSNPIRDYLGDYIKPDRVDGERLARGLAWLSFGLGVGGALMPGRMASAIGVSHGGGNSWFLRMVGMREIGAGAGIMSSPRRPEWVWSRVAGDVMDLSFLMWKLASGDS